EGVRLGLEAGRRARSGEGRADRGRRLDDGGQRGAAHDRAARQRREYREMLTRMAKESGIDTPGAEDLARFDRKRKGKTLSNADWKSPTDPEAKIARMKDGTTHLAYKPEHAVDLDTGVIVAAPIHPADEGDTTTLSPTLEAAARSLDA